jgi:hypothetical protein
MCPKATNLRTLQMKNTADAIVIETVLAVDQGVLGQDIVGAAAAAGTVVCMMKVSLLLNRFCMLVRVL